MNTKILAYQLILAISLTSCAKETTINDIIARYDREDFSTLENTTIHYRSRGHKSNTSIFFINETSSNCGPYVVEFNDKDKIIVKIENHLVQQSCSSNLSIANITERMLQYSKYDIPLLRVDRLGNVYMNPYQAELPILMRKIPESTPNDIHEYKKYKGNWYIRK